MTLAASAVRVARVAVVGPPVMVEHAQMEGGPGFMRTGLTSSGRKCGREIVSSILGRVYFFGNIPKDGLAVKFFSQFFCLGWVSINKVIIFGWPCWFTLVLSAG